MEDIFEQEIEYTDNDSIKQTSVILNTSDSSEVSEVTDIINGCLECVIVETEKPVQVLICLEENPEVVLYSTMNESITGTKYLSIRTHDVSERNEKFLYTNSKWALNNKIKFIVSGYGNSMVKFIVRYK